MLVMMNNARHEDLGGVVGERRRHPAHPYRRGHSDSRLRNEVSGRLEVGSRRGEGDERCMILRKQTWRRRRRHQARRRGVGQHGQGGRCHGRRPTRCRCRLLMLMRRMPGNNAGRGARRHAISRSRHRSPSRGRGRSHALLQLLLSDWLLRKLQRRSVLPDWGVRQPRMSSCQRGDWW